jgi:hypothetical protein
MWPSRGGVPGLNTIRRRSRHARLRLTAASPEDPTRTKSSWPQRGRIRSGVPPAGFEPALGEDSVLSPLWSKLEELKPVAKSSGTPSARGLIQVRHAYRGSGTPSVRSKPDRTHLLPSDFHRSFGLGRVGVEETAGPSARRRETAYVSYPGCRHGHVTNPLGQRGHADPAHTGRRLPTLPLNRDGWGVSEPALRPAVILPTSRERPPRRRRSRT